MKLIAVEGKLDKCDKKTIFERIWIVEREVKIEWPKRIVELIEKVRELEAKGTVVVCEEDPS